MDTPYTIHLLPNTFHHTAYTVHSFFHPVSSCGTVLNIAVIHVGQVTMSDFKVEIFEKRKKNMCWKIYIRKGKTSK